MKQHVKKRERGKTAEWAIARAFRHQLKLPTLARGVCTVTTPLLFLFSVSVTEVAASTFNGNPENYRRLLRQLAPGDTLQLAPGEYRRGLPIHDLQGEPGRPVVIEGPKVGAKAVMLGRPRHNTISIKDASHVTVRNLEIDGKGALVDGVKCEGQATYAHHITLENLHIHNLARYQQSVGISTKCPAWDWIVRGNRIEGVGTGMYFGNSNGEDPFVGGIIEDNDIINTIGYNLQIKHQKARPTIEGMPTEKRFTIIRRNRFVKEQGGSTEEAARPNVLVGHFPLEGPGSDDTYAIYGNLFLENPNEALFQGEGNIALYSNVFYNGHANDFPAIAIQPHNDIPRRVGLFNNRIFHPRVGVRVIVPPDRQAMNLTLQGNRVSGDVPFMATNPDGNRDVPLSNVMAMENANCPSELEACRGAAGKSLFGTNAIMSSDLPELEPAEIFEMNGVSVKNK